jgi:phosphoglycerate-specific signal transduction histidine kinase
MPKEWIVPGAIMGTVLVTSLFFWLILRLYQRKRFRVITEEIETIKHVIVEHKHISEKSTSVTVGSIEEMKLELEHYGKLLEKIRASSNVSQHLDVLEKIVLLGEHLGEIHRDIEAAMTRMLQDLKAQQPVKISELQGQFKSQVEQTRKSLERSITEKVTQWSPQKDRDELIGSIVDSVRYALLVVGKTHQDNLSTYSKLMFEDTGRRTQDVLIQVATQVEALKQKFEEAPLTFGLEKRRKIVKLTDVENPDTATKQSFDGNGTTPPQESSSS